MFSKDVEVDIRWQTDATGSTYKIIFAQKLIRYKGGQSLTGHAFVIWTADDKRNQRTVYFAHGFYPKAGVQFFGKVPSGDLRDDALSGDPSLTANRLTAWVSYGTWLQSQKAINRWKTKDYNLFGDNCISFVRDIAQTTQLSVPKKRKTDFPEGYMKKLIDAND